jgi:lipid II:glycine glycyltransferase (peptidoglycan interpeptide bridge formation enzyme)
MRERGILPWRVFVGMPFGSYTALVPEHGGTLSDASAYEVLRYLCYQFGDSVRVRPWPLSGYMPNGIDGKTHVTSVIDVGDGVEAVLERMEGNTRRMGRQAERRGVTCDRAVGAVAIDEYYAMLEESAKRWGLASPPLSKKLIEAVVTAGGDDVEIWFAHYEGEAIGGGVILYGAEELFFWTAAMRHDYATLRPSNALNFALIGAAAARRVRWYNLGQSQDLPGVKRFKEGLGAKDVPYCSIGCDTPAYRIYAALRGALRGSGRRPSSGQHGDGGAE